MTDLDTYLASFDGEPGYLDWAAFGPLSPVVRAEAQADTELLGSGRRTSIQLVNDHAREARDLVAGLIGTDASQVVLQPSTTYGLMQAIMDGDAPRARDMIDEHLGYVRETVRRMDDDDARRARYGRTPEQIKPPHAGVAAEPAAD